MMSDFLDDMREVVGHLRKAGDIMAKGPLEYYLQKLIEHSAALLERFAPLKVGQKAVIAGRVKCDGGWAGRERTLAIGATGTVASVDYRKGRFVFEFLPDREWWKDHNGQEHECEPHNRHSYCLSEHVLTATTKEQA